MKILIVSQYFWPENFKINDLALALKELNHEVVVLTGKPNYPEGKYYRGYNFFNKRKENYHGITIIRSNLITRGNGNGLRLFLNYCSFALFASFTSVFRIKWNSDIIFVYEPSPITVGVPAIFYKTFSKAPLFFWVQDLWPESLSAAGQIKSKMVLKTIGILVQYIYKKSDIIFVSSNSFLESIKNKGVNPHKIKYLPNWAEDIFVENKHNNINSQGLPKTEGFKIVFAGNIGDAQDFESILAAAELTKSNKDIHWFIIGDGRKKNWVEKQKKDKELDNVHILGKYPLSSMPSFFRDADVLLVSLKNEWIFSLTIPAKIQTYLAFGKPILAMINGEGADIVKEAKAGLTINSGDFEMLAKMAIQMSYMSKEELSEMSKSGKEYYSFNFDKEKLITNLLKEFTSVIIK